MFDNSIVNNQREPLDERHPLGFERWQSKRRRKAQLGIT
jgi:hypothetical protein